MEEKIDFVILWVDGNDEEWLNEKKKYQPNLENKENNNNSRFRDWDNLKHWFRMIEKNANWVNKIFFITWGHIPNWLDTTNKKLRIIKHSDYIPKEYLPTYNSNTIEMNLFRIEELSENFVLFNDDMFMPNKTNKTDFFKNNLPCECYSEVGIHSNKANDIYIHTMLNNMSIVNKYFNKKKVYKRNFFKYINIKYGLKDNLSTLTLLPFRHFSLIVNKHLPVSLKKSVLKQLWEKEPEVMRKSSLNRFRDLSDISQYLIRYYQICSGNFIPRKSNFGMYYRLENNNNHIIKDLEKNKYKIVCFNDTPAVTNFEESRNSLNSYLESKYPKKSSFEK